MEFKYTPDTIHAVVAVDFAFPSIPLSGASEGRFTLRLGRCQHWPHPHWADIVYSNSSDLVHRCAHDHIEDWPLRIRVFNVREQALDRVLGLHLSFVPCPLNPLTSLVVHLHPLAYPSLARASLAELKRASEELTHDLQSYGRKIDDDFSNVKNIGNLVRSVSIFPSSSALYVDDTHDALDTVTTSRDQGI